MHVDEKKLNVKLISELQNSESLAIGDFSKIKGKECIDGRFWVYSP